MPFRPGPCRSVFRSIIVATGLLAALTGAAEPAAEGVSPALKTDTLELAWSGDDPTPQRWKIRADDAGGESGWRSLITRDSRALALSRHLALSTPGSEAIDWQVESVDANTVTASAVSDESGLAFRQTFSVAGGDYRLRLAVEVENLSATEAELDDFGLTLGPGMGEIPVEGLGIATGLYSFVDAIGSIRGQVERPALPEAGESDTLESLAEPDWLGLYTRYFALLIAPEETSEITAVELESPGETAVTTLPHRYLPQLFLTLDTAPLAAGESRRWEFSIFSGPRSRTATAAGETSFDAVLFPGLWEWMRYLCFGLLWLLEALFALIPSWGLAIIVLAVLVRLAMYPLARRALAGQQAFAEVQQKIQPRIREIKKNYSGGEQSERILKLYERHNVSPLAGLKPLLIVLVQIPVFIALFHVLGQAYELREAPFLWIETLAEPDRLFAFGTDLPFFGSHFNLLPVLLALTTLATLKLSPAPAADATARRRQNIFLGLMTVGFFLIFYPFPSGMVLYWTTANVLHIAQSRITTSSSA